MKIKNKLKDISLLFFSIIFLIVLLELVLKIFWKNNESNMLNNTLTPIIDFDPVLGTKYKKNSNHKIISQYNEFEVNYEINEYGLRTSKLNLDTNNFKIFGIGNSYLEGWGVNEDSTFISIYNKSTKRKIINAGISGYGVIQSSLVAKKYLEKFNPNKVIIPSAYGTTSSSVPCKLTIGISLSIIQSVEPTAPQRFITPWKSEEYSWFPENPSRPPDPTI